MNDNLYAEIIQSDQTVSKLRGKLPPMFGHLTYSRSGDSPSQSKKPAKKFQGLTSRDESELENEHLQQRKMLQRKRFMIHIDSVNKVTQASMLGSSYIVFRIRFTRMSDLESRSTWKRYSDMQSWYQEVVILMQYCIVCSWSSTTNLCLTVAATRAHSCLVSIPPESHRLVVNWRPERSS